MQLPLHIVVLVVTALGSSACRLSHDRGELALDLSRPNPMGGVTVSADADAWVGEAWVPEHVTVILVTMHNDGSRPLRLFLDDVHLIDAADRRYAPLPLYLVDRDADGEHVRQEFHWPHPRLGHDRFSVAAPYRPYYPGLPVHRERWLSDPGDYDHAAHYAYWDAVPPLPTPHMVDVAIPEGVVGGSGYVAGFVYFERVDPRASTEVSFVLDLVDADSGERLGEVELPLRAGE